MVMDAKKYLEQYEKIDAIIINKTIEAEKWDELAKNITSQMGDERVQSSGSQQRMADAINKSVDIKAEVEALIMKKKEITDTIQQLPKMEYDVLHRIYIQSKSFKEVELETKNTYTWVTTTHGRALQHLQELLENRDKTQNEYKML